MLYLLLCSYSFLQANTAIDSISARLIEEAKSSYQSNDEVFGLTKTLSKNYSQTFIDSVLKKIPDSPQKAYTNSYLAFHTFDIDSKAAFHYIEQAKDIAKPFKEPKLWYWINRHEAFVKESIGEYEKAIHSLNLSTGYAITSKYERGRIINLVHYSENFFELANYEKAFEYAFKNLEARKDLKPEFGLGYAYQHLGLLFFNIEDYTEAYSQYSKAEKIYKRLGVKSYEGLMLKYKAATLIEQGSLDSALVLSNQARQIFETIGDNHFLSIINQQLGEISFNKKDYKSALNYLAVTDSIIKISSTGKYVHLLNKQFGDVYLSLSQYDLAEQYFQQYISGIKSESLNRYLTIGHSNLAELYLQKGDFKKAKSEALKAIKNSKHNNNNIYLLTALQQLNESHFQLKEFNESHTIQKRIFELDKKIRQNLNKKNATNLKLKHYSQLQKNTFEKESLIAKQKQTSSKKIIWIVLLGFIIISFLLLQLIRSSKKRNNSLAIKNKEIASLNESLESKVTERTTALEEKTEVLNNYFDNLPGVAYRFLCNADFTPVFISKNCYELFGLSPEYILHSQTSRNLIHPKHHRDVISKTNDFVKKNNHQEVLELTHLISSKNNAAKWVMNRCKISINPDGKKFLDGIFIDITDQMITEAALRIHQNELSIIYNNTQDFIGLIKVDENETLTIESVNKPYLDFLIKKKFIPKDQKLTGLNMREYLGDILRMPKEGMDKRIEFLNNVRHSKKAITYETKIPLVAKKQDLFKITLTPVLDKESNTCSRIIFVLHDITEQKKAQKALKYSESQLSSIYSASQDLIGLINKDKAGHLTVGSMNQPAVNLYKNIKPHININNILGQKIEYIYTTIYGLTDKEIKTRVQRINEVFDQLSTIKYEIPFTPPGKNIKKYFETVISPILNEKGKCNQALYVTRDITARKTANDKVIASEKQLSMIFNGSKDIFFIFDVTPNRELILANANESFIKRIKYLNKNKNLIDFFGKKAYSFLKEIMNHTEEEIQNRIQIAQKAIETKTPIEYPETLITNDNLKYLSEVTVTPIFNNEGVCEKLFYVSRNVTQKVVAQQALASSEKRLSTIYNSSQDIIGLIKLNTEGDYEIESINQATIQLLKKAGISVEVDFLLGMKMKKLFSDLFDLSKDLTEQRMKMLSEVFTNNKTFKYKSPFKPKNSSVSFDFETIISPILNEDGHCTQALYTARNITESELAKARLLSNQKRLESIFNGANDQMAILDLQENGNLVLEDSNLSFQNGWKKTKIPYELQSFYGKEIKHYLSKVMRFSEKETQRRVDICKQITIDKKPITYEDIFIGYDNNKYIIDVSISAILDKEDNCKKLLFVFRDVTLKKQSKRKNDF